VVRRNELMQRYGVAICHFNRTKNLGSILEAVKLTAPTGSKIVLCDDGSDEPVEQIARDTGVVLVRGPNKGVAANKNRALWALQDCAMVVVLEDDLKPTAPGWFEDYEKAALLSGIHHFCRVQDRQVPEAIPSFAEYMKKNGLTPIYGPSPRGDLTFLTNTVIQTVGAFNPLFRGAGYAHGEWSKRVAKAGLIGHPLTWVDFQEAQQKFIQVGDTEGGRWEDQQAQRTGKQLKRNKQVLLELNKRDYIYHELVLE
jgi:glycosyltransferase involved in cell wall biosynthesis